MNFKLTYATMFNPPAEMHTRFDAALAELNRSLGATHPLYINGEDRVTANHDTRRSPIDQRRILGHFSLATVDDVNDAMAAAQAAFQALYDCTKATGCTSPGDLNCLCAAQCLQDPPCAGELDVCVGATSDAICEVNCH